MNILLDTCTILWLQLEPSRVPAALRKILLKPETRRYSSAAAAWEIAIKWSLGKLPLPVPPHEFMRRLRTESLVESLPIDEASVLQVTKLPGLHNDPFDRIQISQSIEHSLILATPDPLIRQYAVRTIWELTLLHRPPIWRIMRWKFVETRSGTGLAGAFCEFY